MKRPANSSRLMLPTAVLIGSLVAALFRFHGAAAQTPATLPTAPAPLNTVLGQLALLTDAQTRSVSAENPTGEKGKGGMWVPNPADPNLPHSGAATVLGQGWMVRPFLRVHAIAPTSKWCLCDRAEEATQPSRVLHR